MEGGGWSLSPCVDVIWPVGDVFDDDKLNAAVARCVVFPLALRSAPGHHRENRRARRRMRPFLALSITWHAMSGCVGLRAVKGSTVNSWCVRQLRWAKGRLWRTVRHFTEIAGRWSRRQDDAVRGECQAFVLWRNGRDCCRCLRDGAGERTSRMPPSTVMFVSIGRSAGTVFGVQGDLRPARCAPCRCCCHA